MTLTFNRLRAMVMTYSHAKVQCQRLIGCKDKSGNKWTEGQMDGSDHITSLANAVGKYERQNITLLILHQDMPS